LGGVGLSILLIPIIAYAPGFQYIFETQSLPWQLFICPGLPFAMLILIIEEIRKVLLRKGLNVI